jgi:hypothetical protein
VEIKINITKDKAKNQYYEIQYENSTAIIIYTDGSGIKSEIGVVIYDTIINEVVHQHLGKDIQYNVFMMELAAL